MTKAISLVVLDSTAWPKLRGKYLPITFEDGKPSVIRNLVVTKIERRDKVIRLYTANGWTDFVADKIEEVFKKDEKATEQYQKIVETQ